MKLKKEKFFWEAKFNNLKTPGPPPPPPATHTQKISMTLLCVEISFYFIIHNETMPGPRKKLHALSRGHACGDDLISLFLAMIMYTDTCKMTIAEIVNIRIFMYNCNLNAYL